MEAMMDFRTLLTLISTTAIVAGGIFAAVQLRHLNKQRARDSAMQMLHSFQTREFMDGYDIIFNLPMGLSKKEIEERVGDRMVSVLVVLGTFESLGILVHRREISLELIDDFFSGGIVLAWKKFEKYIVGVRELNKRETYAEWVQWLAEQFEKRESTTPVVPAHIAFRDWKE